MIMHRDAYYYALVMHLSTVNSHQAWMQRSLLLALKPLSVLRMKGSEYRIKNRITRSPVRTNIL